MGSIHQDFKAYIFIKQGNCFAMVVHLSMKFAAISATTLHLQDHHTRIHPNIAPTAQDLAVG